MRTVNIDLSTENAGNGEKIYVGYTGEHNATELVAEIPQAMARESDYLIAVFLTGDKIVRSRKITAERDFGAPYLDGDEVHIYLSQKLTGNTTLGIQIEGYAKDENGISTLVGKSAYISNLTFRLSPKGAGDDSVMPDYDEIAEMIRKASENAKGTGIEKYETFVDLPAEAEEGDLAYVINDYGETITVPFEFEKRYERLVPKQSIEKEYLALLPQVEMDEGVHLGAAGVKIRTASADHERICYCTFLYYEPVGSIMAFADFASQDDLDDYGVEESIYVYLSSDGDFAPVIDSDEPVILSSGWYEMKEKRKNYHIERGYAEADYSFEFEPVAYGDIAAFEGMRNCIARPEFDGDEDPAALAVAGEVLKGCMDIYSEPLQRSGLYIFKNGVWKRLPMNRIVTATARPDLPVAAEDGQTAVVEENTLLIENRNTYIYENMQFKDLYINPEPPEYMWLSDCRMKGAYGYIDSSTGVFTPISEESRGFELVSDKNRKYVFIGLNQSPWDSYRQYYLYTEKAGDVSLPSGMFDRITVTVIHDAPKGWSRIEENNGTYTARPITRYEELPYVRLSDYTYAEYYFSITEYVCELNSQAFIGWDVFYRSDNARGLWYFSLGRWRKAGDTDA